MLNLILTLLLASPVMADDFDPDAFLAKYGCEAQLKQALNESENKDILLNIYKELADKRLEQIVILENKIKALAKELE